MKKVFVSGCYDILHAGHVRFFKDARALGDHLTVSFASTEVLMLAKQRKPSVPDESKRALISAIRFVDSVVTSSDVDPVFDFVRSVKKIRPHIIAVTEHDANIAVKKEFCKKHNIELVVLPRRAHADISTSSILANIQNISEVPLRVDFAGGWLDVPRFAKKGGYIVNCTITPAVSLTQWPYEKESGLGGSAAYSLLSAKDGVASELGSGVGWQDPAVIVETGLCVWRSGKTPVLDMKFNPEWLTGAMLLVWTGKGHVTKDIAPLKRDYARIVKAGRLAREAAHDSSLRKMAAAVNLGYKVQIDEGMDPLPAIPNSIARKYLGSGHGGYALYLFSDKAARNRASKRRGAKIIEPYILHAR